MGLRTPPLSRATIGDAIDFDCGAEGQICATDRDPGWWGVAYHCHVSLVHLVESGHVGEIDVHFHHVPQPKADRLEDLLDVAQCLGGLWAGAAIRQLGGVPQGPQTSGYVDVVTGDHRVAERRDTGQTFDDDLLHAILSLPIESLFRVTGKVGGEERPTGGGGGAVETPGPDEGVGA